MRCGRFPLAASFLGSGMPDLTADRTEPLMSTDSAGLPGVCTCMCVCAAAAPLVVVPPSHSSSCRNMMLRRLSVQSLYHAPHTLAENRGTLQAFGRTDAPSRRQEGIHALFLMSSSRTRRMRAGFAQGPISHPGQPYQEFSTTPRRTQQSTHP